MAGRALPALGAMPMLLPAETILDRADAMRRIDAIARDAGDQKALRTAAMEEIAARHRAGRDAIARAIAEHPFDAPAAVHAYSALTDGLVQLCFHLATRHLVVEEAPGEAHRLSVLAVGGYGRGEMAPFSDVDLLFLAPRKLSARCEKVVELTLYALWDLRLKVGHASRSLADCLRLGREDMTIRTSLIEVRYLEGDEDLARTLRDRLRKELFAGTEAAFIEAKLAERDARHRKQGGQRYMVEPNVKEGKGGLRDLQTLFWIAKYVHGVDAPRALVPLGVFTAEELAAFERAEAFLWAVRNQLHLIAGRAMDQLTFDLQVEVAERLRYVDRAGRRAVEHFMQDYFRHATRVGDLTRVFLTAMEANHVKPAPSLKRLLTRRRKLRPGFELRQNRVAIADEAAFLSEPLNLLRLFDEALRTGYSLHPDATRLVVANLHLIDDRMRRDPEANKIFLNMLLKHGQPDRALKRMKETGVLGAFLPEFQPIIAMMQFNMYHHYTVDEHTIVCIATLAAIERGDRGEHLPLCSEILGGAINRRVLYVALLLHDIGKGRPEDHSVLGARIARRVGPRLGLKPQECATVEWLVRYHLLMSDMAQKRDIADPRTVRDFAKAVKTQNRLDLLLVLTTCDIIGVGPGTWNNWKAQLLRNLYAQTRSALATGLEEVNREAQESEAKRALRAALPDWDKARLRQETQRHYGPYWQGLQTATHVVFARLLDGLADDEIRIDLTEDEGRDATRVCIVMADHPGIFARLAGSLALVGANVVDARTYTSNDGYATAVFWVQDADGAPYDTDRMTRLKAMIGKTLCGEVHAGEAMIRRDRIKKRERAFRHPTSIAFDNEGSDIYTIIEVDTRDRPGLLYDLARTLADANIYISSAQIATYGAQAVDTFYVKDMFGLKIVGQQKLDTLERKLKAAISSGASKAAAE